MGKYRDMIRETCRDMERVGGNDAADADLTVERMPRDESVSPYGKTGIGRPKHGLGFPSRAWGRDEDE